MNERQFYHLVGTYRALTMRTGKDYSPTLELVARRYIQTMMEQHPGADASAVEADVFGIVRHEIPSFNPTVL